MKIVSLIQSTENKVKNLELYRTLQNICMGKSSITFLSLRYEERKLTSFANDNSAIKELMYSDLLADS